MISFSSHQRILLLKYCLIPIWLLLFSFLSVCFSRLLNFLLSMKRTALIFSTLEQDENYSESETKCFGHSRTICTHTVIIICDNIWITPIVGSIHTTRNVPIHHCYVQSIRKYQSDHNMYCRSFSYWLLKQCSFTENNDIFVLPNELPLVIDELKKIHTK